MARHCTNGQSVHSLARCQPWASRSIVFASRVSLAEMAVSRRVSAGETRPASRSRRQTVTTLGLSWTRFGGPSPARLHHALTSRVLRGFASIVLFEPGPCRAQECKGVTTRSALPEVLCAMLLPAPPTVPGSDLPGALLLEACAGHATLQWQAVNCCQGLASLAGLAAAQHAGTKRWQITVVSIRGGKPGLAACRACCAVRHSIWRQGQASDWRVFLGLCRLCHAGLPPSGGDEPWASR